MEEQEVVEGLPPAEAPAAQETEQAPVQQPDEEQVQTVKINQIGEQDVRGVSINNVDSEFKRKYEELLDRQPEMISEAVRQAFQQQQTQSQPQYTEEQLDLVLFDDTGTYSAANKAWASKEKAKIQEQRMESLIKQQFGLSQEQQRSAMVKAESEKYVVNTFPDMFNKGADGRVTWNTQNPMTQLVAKYMNNPAYKDRPDGLREAARQAFVDYQLSTRGKQMQQTQLQASQEAQAKKQNMGGGTGSINQGAASSAEINAAYEKFRQTGDPRDAVAYKRAVNASKARQ